MQPPPSDSLAMTKTSGVNEMKCAGPISQEYQTCSGLFIGILNLQGMGEAVLVRWSADGSDGTCRQEVKGDRGRGFPAFDAMQAPQFVLLEQVTTLVISWSSHVGYPAGNGLDHIHEHIALFSMMGMKIVSCRNSQGQRVQHNVTHPEFQEWLGDLIFI